MKETMNGLVYELCDVTCWIEGKTELLSDVRVTLQNLRDAMDEAAMHGAEEISFREHHRTIRLLAELMYHLAEGMISNSAKASEISEKLFHQIVKPEPKT